VHFCAECGRWGAYGYGVNLRAGRLGHWYCALYQVIEINPPVLIGVRQAHAIGRRHYDICFMCLDGLDRSRRRSYDDSADHGLRDCDCRFDAWHVIGRIPHAR
jgi:hypothetical protein